jgi:NADPH2:quinone reductase
MQATATPAVPCTRATQDSVAANGDPDHESHAQHRARRPGDPGARATCAAPSAGAGEVRIRVRACGVNYPDTLIIEDKYQFRPGAAVRAPAARWRAKSTRSAHGVSALQGGRSRDRHARPRRHGGAGGEQARAEGLPQARPGMPFDEAATFVLTYGTSYHALKQRAQLEAGRERCWCWARPAAWGSRRWELGQARWARKRDRGGVERGEARAGEEAHGADSGVVYPAGPFDKDGTKALAALFKDACGANGADVVYDAVGGDYAEAALRSTAWEGRFLVVGFPAGIPRIPLNLALLKNCAIVGIFWGAWTERDPQASQQNNRELVDFYTQGKIKPHISGRYPLAQAGQAIADLAARKALGKLVVMIDE